MSLISLQEAEDLLLNQQVVAIPTDTVYGLAALLSSSTAVQALFELKNRPKNNPMLILTADEDQIRPYVSTFPPFFKELAREFWPGGLSLVIPVDCDKVSDLIRSGRTTAGFRVPDHVVALELLRRCGPLVTTSANLSGEVPATSAYQVLELFPKVPLLDGGESVRKVPSTILCYEQDRWQMQREGSVSMEEIRRILE